MSDPFDVDHDDAWSEAFGIGASHPDDADPAAGSAADAASAGSAFDFEPDEVSSDDDYDFTGDGVVDHHDVHEALAGFHDFHVEDADLGHHGGDHHDDPGVHGHDDPDGHLDPHDPGHVDAHHTGHHDVVDDGGGHFAF